MTYINPKRLFVGCFVANWLRERKELTMTAKVLYATLVQHANDEGVAWPSQETLAQEMGCTDRCVRSGLALLEEHGLIETQQPGLGASNRYRFGWHEWMGIPEPRPEESSARPELFSARPEKSSKDKNQVKESSIRGVSPSDILDHFNKVSGKRYTPKGSGFTAIKARLGDGASEAEMRLVADHKASQWKDDPKMREYLRPETIYAKSHWESYLQAAQDWKGSSRGLRDWRE